MSTEWCTHCLMQVELTTQAYDAHTVFRCNICRRILDRMWHDEDSYTQVTPVGLYNTEQVQQKISEMRNHLLHFIGCVIDNYEGNNDVYDACEEISHKVDEIMPNSPQVEMMDKLESDIIEELYKIRDNATIHVNGEDYENIEFDSGLNKAINCVREHFRPFTS